MTARTSMRQRVEGYLRARRALGVELSVAGSQLLNFARWADAHGHGNRLTTAAALEWALSSTRARRVGHASRLGLIGTFAKWLLAFDSRTEIPPSGILGPRGLRPPPHIYDEGEIRALIAAAGRIQPRSGLNPRTYQTLLGLLACTGLRPAETRGLRLDDVDLERKHLRIRETKFHKSRLVPLHATSCRALAAYVRHRGRAAKGHGDEDFFLLDEGRSVTKSRLHATFLRLRRDLGWGKNRGVRAPRLYDLRHSFACRRLLRWHAEEADAQAGLPALSTYLGHVHVTGTYWYLTATPELLAAVGARFERYAARSSERAR